MDRLRIATLNIWNRQGPFPERLALIRRGLETLRPDLVALQEVLRHDAEPLDQAQEIAAGLGYYSAFAAATQLGGGLQFGNAILSRFPIASAQNLLLPGESGEETRALLHAEIDAPFGRLAAFVTHLTWQLDHGWVRERQVAFIVDKMRELAPPGAGFPALLMGDFNAEPDSEEIRYLRGFTSRLGRSVCFVDCFAAAGNGSPGYTFARSNAFAETAGEPNRRLDYLFVRGPLQERRGEPLTAQICFDAPSEGVFASDHFGVFAELRVA